MKRPCILQWVAPSALFASVCQAQDASITVHADQTVHRISCYLTGACIEDVNHEVYGGIDSQMIFGECFAETRAAPAPKGFYGLWRALDTPRR